MVQVAPEFKDFSLEEFSWARMMVASRNFGITIGEVKTDALVPLADMLNHYRPRETKCVRQGAVATPYAAPPRLPPPTPC